MPKIRSMLALPLVLTLFATNAAAFAENQTDASVTALLNAIRANRKALVAASLELTDREAASFWPIYDRYQKEIDATGDRLVAVIGDYVENLGKLSDEQAVKLVEDYLAVEADRLKVRSSYLHEFSSSLPGRKLARFYQIENKMDALTRYELSSTIPVLEDKGTPTAK